jgi:hypothetical protein
MVTGMWFCLDVPGLITPEEKTALKNDRSSKNTHARSQWTKDDTLVLAMHAKKVFPFSALPMVSTTMTIVLMEK